jgi:site-specific DNA-methyltransferase (adenine-specific)
MLDINNIYHGDCLELMKEIPDKSIDLVVTSPPYLSMRNYSGEKKQFGYFETKENYIKNLINIFYDIKRILKDTGSFVLNIDDVFDREWQNVPFELISKIKEYLILQETLIWIKKNPQPILSTQRLTHGFEYCFLFIKNNKKFEFNKSKIDFISDTFYCKIGNKGKTEHIAVFPNELPQFFIELLTKENDLILDCFSGSGTTAIVCKKLKRKFIGIDVNKEYCMKAIKRINDYKPQTKLEFA